MKNAKNFWSGGGNGDDRGHVDHKFLKSQFIAIMDGTRRNMRSIKVLDDLEMEMQDVMDVTEEMMAYLRGDRKNLEVKTVIAGEEGMFFNEREKLHMEDVQGLFLGGIQIRRVAFVIFAAAVLLILFSEREFKRDFTSDVWMAVGSVPWGGSSGLEGWFVD